jgi:hypothetical protein
MSPGELIIWPLLALAAGVSKLPVLRFAVLPLFPAKEVRGVFGTSPSSLIISQP